MSGRHVRRLAVGVAVSGLAGLGVSLPVGAAESGISPSVGAALLAKSRQVAARAGDRHPYDIEAVSTTRAEAQQLLCGAHCAGLLASDETPVYLVSMRGYFPNFPHSEPLRHHRPRLHPHVTVISIPFIAATMTAATTAYGDAYPDLKAAGVPVGLDSAGRQAVS